MLSALRGPREALAGDLPLVGALGSVLAELGEAEAKGAGGRSLAQVLEGVPPAAPGRSA